MIYAEIISQFTKELGRELTINQISKEIKKSYASVNFYAREMIKKGILSKKNVGSAILCSLNLENEECLSYLVFNSMRANTRPGSRFPNDKISLSISNKIYVVDGKAKGASTISMDRLIKLAKKNLSSIRIIKGHEQFWRLIKESLS